MISTNDNLDNSDQWIKVYIRVRPLLRQEIGQDRILTVDSDNKTICLEGSSTYTFRQTFDKAFGENSKQIDVFQDFKNHSQSILQGYNFSVLAYGQTGSGKTYTMFGNDWEYLSSQGGPKQNVKIQHQSTFFEDISQDIDNAGMIPRSIYHIFNLVEQQNKKGQQCWFVYCSFLQIYNEKIYDLLVDNDLPQSLQIHESRLDGVFVEGLSEYAVNHYYDCLTLMKRGEKNRFIRSTSMNAKSSRSHTIFQVQIEASKADETGSIKRSKMNLCDLAGSEKADRQVNLKKAHLTELININQSLTTLGKVIQNLSQNSSRKNLLPIPYRESKLTRLLQDSLGGNTQTYFIANVSSSMYNLDETYSTLKFAERAKNITISVAPNKVDARNSDLINKLTREINYLKSLLNMKRNGLNPNDLHFKMVKLQEENEKLRTSKVSVNEVEQLIAENRQMKLEIQKLHQTVSMADVSSQNSEVRQFTDPHALQLESLTLHSQYDSFPNKLKSLNSTHQFQSANVYSGRRNHMGSDGDSSAFRSGGMMIVNSMSAFPKTEVQVRIKGKNNTYSLQKGYVEQSEKQSATEKLLKNERQRVLERLQALDNLKRENEYKLKTELDQIESRSKNNYKMNTFERLEKKEKKRLNNMDVKLKIIESALII